jgi:hypothetical protein
VSCAPESVSRHLQALGAPVRSPGPGAWQIELESAGHPLVLNLAVRGALLRAEAAVLPADVIEPRQLLFWNGQAPLVCFAENRTGEVIVCGEVPLAALDAELLDRFLGLLHAAATRARQYVLPGA